MTEKLKIIGCENCDGTGCVDEQETFENAYGEHGLASEPCGVCYGTGILSNDKCKICGGLHSSKKEYVQCAKICESLLKRNF